MDLGLRAVSRTATATWTLLGPCLPPRTTKHGTNLYRLHQCGPIRQYNIRRVITKKPSEITNTPIAADTVVRKTFVERQATAPIDENLEEQASTPLRYIHHTNSPGANLEHIDVDEWRSNLNLPPDAFWKRWSVALAENDAGGLRTAENFVERWINGQFKTIIHTARLEPLNSGRRIFQCTRISSLPLFGARTVVSYGYNKTEAYRNQKIALVSQLYQSGELDEVYKGTIASRKLLMIYGQAAKYGFFPRFKNSMSNDKAGAQFQITLAAPEWSVQALSCAPTYTEALSAVVESYNDQVKKRGVKSRLGPEATRERLEILESRTSGRVLEYLVHKLQINNYHWHSTRLDTQGPQWIRTFSGNRNKNAGVPMLRKKDAQTIGTIIAVVRILQAFGFDAMDGYQKYVALTWRAKAEGEESSDTRPRLSMADMDSQVGNKI